MAVGTTSNVPPDTTGRLREAARVLRSQVDRLTTDTARWDEAFPSRNVYGDMSTYERLIVHPGVGLAVADWLDLTAKTPAFDIFAKGRKSHVTANIRAALAVADAILGGAS